MRKSIIGTSILVFAVSLIMIISPEAWLKVTVIMLGVFALGNGVYNFIVIRPLVTESGYQRIITIRAITSIVVGLAAITLPLMLVEVIWTIMIYVLATYLILSAIAEFISLSQLKQAGLSQKVVTTEIIVSFALAILLFVLPRELALIFIRIIGCILLVGSIGLAAWEWKNRSLKIEVEEVD